MFASIFSGEITGLRSTGHFGCVYRGLLRCEDEKNEIDVAVKTLKSLTGYFLSLAVTTVNVPPSTLN